MAAPRPSNVGIIANLQDEMENVDLQPLAGPPQNYAFPYPPNLTDPALRPAFDQKFIEHTRLVHLHRAFTSAVNNITFKAGSTAVHRATDAQIMRAKNQLISELAFEIWTTHYGYGTGDVEIKAETNFKIWAADPMRTLRDAILEFSEDEAWRELISAPRYGKW